MNGVPINRDPSNNELQLIVALYSRGDFKKALSLSKQLCTRFPESAMPFNLCGAVHAALFEYDLAVESYAQAIKIDPTSADFYSNMASAQVDRGEIDGAIKSYQKAIEIDPNYAEAYSDLGLAFQKKRQIGGGDRLLQSRARNRFKFCRSAFQYSECNAEDRQR